MPTGPARRLVTQQVGYDQTEKIHRGNEEFGQDVQIFEK